MASDASADRIVELDRSTCEQLLGSGSVGRVAINGDPSPVVLPVNYAVRDGAVVFRTVEGTKWEAARAEQPASFEVDGIDREHRSGWSILARGRLEALGGDDPVAADVLDELDPLAGGDRPHLVRLTVEELTGRRIPPDAAWTRAHRDHNTWYDRDGSDLLG